MLGLPPVLPMMAGTDLSAWSGGGVVIVINKADICTVIWGWRADERGWHGQCHSACEKCFAQQTSLCCMQCLLSLDVK